MISSIKSPSLVAVKRFLDHFYFIFQSNAIVPIDQSQNQDHDLDLDQELGLNRGPDFDENLNLRKKNKNFSLIKKILWSICLLLFVRLIFCEDGIYDYVSMEKVLHVKNSQWENINKENEILSADISMIENDHSFQKQLVRENLGFVASDEFLILFAKEKKKKNSLSKKFDH